MALTSIQRKTLEQMGIPVWLSRDAVVIESESESKERTHTEISADLSLPYWVFVDSLPETKQQHMLLSSMLKAISLDMSNIALIESIHHTLISTKHSESKRILFLDMVEAQKQFDVEASVHPKLHRLTSAALLVVTHSLSDLIQNQRLKAHAWEALKLLSTVNSET